MKLKDFRPIHVLLISGTILGLGVLLLTFFGSNTLILLLVVIGALGIWLGGMWKNMINGRGKKRK